MLVLAADAQARLRHLSSRLGGFALASHDALEREPALAAAYANVVALDPPTSEAAIYAPRFSCSVGHPFAPQRLFLAWGGAWLRFATHIHEREYGLRDSLATCYRARYATGAGRPVGSSRWSCAGRGARRSAPDAC